MRPFPKIRLDFIKRTLVFRFDAGTSRGVLKTRDVYWIKAFAADRPEVNGWGEAAPLINLSPDYEGRFDEKLRHYLDKAEELIWLKNEEDILMQVKALVPFDAPSVRFGLETALLDLLHGGKKKIVDNPFYTQHTSIPINGLIWMGDRDFMHSQIREKLDQGFTCIKMKIGSIDFDQEIELLEDIRSAYNKDKITLRVDANGAFVPSEAMQKLERLAELDIHSIEQPIRAGLHDQMEELCASTPVPIALDEELIGGQDKSKLLDRIRPQHIILKPTLLGGVLETREWVKSAEQRGIGWWVTSALESNIGLNAIAQLTSSFAPSIPQGLGTGKLYHNNLNSPLEIGRGELWYNEKTDWEQPA